MRIAALLVLAGAAAAQDCRDNGPWPCAEEGCPSASITCERLKKNCASAFTDVWNTPPAGMEDARVADQCPVTCGKCKPGAGGAEKATASGESKCISWRQTNDCNANGKRQAQKDRSCSTKIQEGWSGYCECSGGIRAGESSCQHEVFTCEAKCSEQWEWLRQQRAKKSAAADEPFDADGSLTKLYKRGKGFYVMGNTELALRHFREALKLDPEHKECKADYKQAKKLAKILEKIEAVMGKDVEGKGRQKALEREEQYEEARELLTAALDLLPPSVYRASLYRDLCVCNTKTRRSEEALKTCKQHAGQDGGIASQLLLGEAMILNGDFEQAVKVYREAIALDEHSQEARQGLEKAEKLLKRSKEVDYYKLLNVSRDATPRELKRVRDRNATVTPRLHHGHTTVAPRSHHGHTTVTPRSHHGRTTVTPRSHHGHMAVICGYAAVPS